MSCEEFISAYWSQYILLEKEFISTLHYLSLDSENENAFSQAYAKLILELGSEIDVVLKQYCKNIDKSFKGTDMGEYKDCIQCNSDFIKQQVEEKITHRILNPWIEWSTSSKRALCWWKVYNKVKHNRTELTEIDNVKKSSYKFANQKYTLLALAGLYQILVYTYYPLAIGENKKILTPMPGSRLFKLKGGMWDSIDFWDELAFYVEDGNICIESSSVHY